MAQVFIGGDNEFNALVYGEKHPATIQYLQTQLYQPSVQLTAASQQFFADSQDLFERFNSAEALSLAQAAIRKVKGVFQPNSIRPLWELSELQNAPLVMQRWIMAQPDIRQAYHAQRLDGYADTYVDMHPGACGSAHYDWRRVNEGVLQPVDHPDYDWQHTEYFDDLVEGDRHLSLEEKVDILSTWDMVQAFYRQGKDDPTSPFGGKL